MPTLPPGPLLIGGVEVPDRLQNEPAPPAKASGAALLARIGWRSALIALLFLLTAGLWPIYLGMSLVWGAAPNVPRGWQIARYLRLTWTVRPSDPGLSALERVWITLSILRKIAVIPLWGCAWLLDEALYGRALRATPVVAPLIEISAARSGSTQLARYLEDDPRLVAPNLLQSVFPYLWLWKLAPRTLGRLVTPDQVRHKMEQMMPPEFLQRHEGDPFRTDTFDAALYISHMNFFAMMLGADVIADDIAMGTVAPHNRPLWDHLFLDMLDGIGRKTLLYAGPAPDGGPRRFFVKGHFLAGAEGLARRYPDARFLTMIREPAPRLQSAVNFMRANPRDPVLGNTPWTWLAEGLTRTESAYCVEEQAWFTRPGGARRTVLRFDAYVKDLEGALRTVYRECLDTPELPPHAPRQHPPRQRTNYLLNRSLASLGIDEAALNAQLAPYIRWCRGEEIGEA